jgi:voltage-gated sodium channel
MTDATVKSHNSDTNYRRDVDLEKAREDASISKDNLEEYDKSRGVVYKICDRIIHFKWFNNFILALIILNSIILGLETSPAIMSKVGLLLGMLDTFCIIIFCLEILIKIISYGATFFKSGWNVFDFLVIAASILPFSREISIFRAVRFLRTFRMVSRFGKLRVLVDAIIRTIPTVGWLIFLLLIMMYVFSVITTNFYGKEFPQTFGSIGHSMYTLFQLLTLDSWSSIVLRPMLEKFPNAYFVFIPYIVISSFIILNVFVGIVVNVVNDISFEASIIRGEKNKNDKNENDDKTEKDKKVHSVPSYLINLENDFTRFKDQLNRIEEMLKAERK